MELLLLALGSCTGSTLFNSQEEETACEDYRIEVSGERRDDHPRAYTRMF